jgi:hypothetical protein
MAQALPSTPGPKLQFQLSSDTSDIGLKRPPTKDQDTISEIPRRYNQLSTFTSSKKDDAYMEDMPTP